MRAYIFIHLNRILLENSKESTYFRLRYAKNVYKEVTGKNNLWQILKKKKKKYAKSFVCYCKKIVLLV